MSRSSKKTPVHGMTMARSEKDDKKDWHQRHRRRERQELKSAVTQGEPDAFMPVDRREVSDPWSMAKDGKRYYTADSIEKVVSKAGPHDAKAVERARYKFLAK